MERNWPENLWQSNGKRTRNVRDEESTYGWERWPRTGPDGYIEWDELDVENRCSPDAGEESGDVPSRVGLAFAFGLLHAISVWLLLRHWPRMSDEPKKSRLPHVMMILLRLCLLSVAVSVAVSVSVSVSVSETLLCLSHSLFRTKNEKQQNKTKKGTQIGLFYSCP